MSIKNKLIALTCAATLTAAGATSLGLSGAHAAGMSGLTPNTAAAGIYGTNHLEGMPDTAQLVYDYNMDGSIMDKPFHDEIVLDFKRRPPEAKDAEADKGAEAGKTEKTGDEATFDVNVTLFPGTRNLPIGPITSTSFNPLLVIFFQRDVNQMGRNTGGSNHYFRNVIRHAMGAPGHQTETEIKIDWQGREVAATRVSFQPFIKDENRTRMKSFASKTYAVTLAPELPGGLYEISTETTEADTGKVLLREVYRLRDEKS